MAIQVPNGLDGIRASIQLNLVAFHRFLDGLTNLVEPGVDARLTDARVGGRPNGFHQVIVPWIEGQCERAINHATYDIKKISLRMNLIVRAWIE